MHEEKKKSHDRNTDFNRFFVVTYMSFLFFLLTHYSLLRWILLFLFLKTQLGPDWAQLKTRVRSKVISISPQTSPTGRAWHQSPHPNIFYHLKNTTNTLFFMALLRYPLNMRSYNVI